MQLMLAHKLIIGPPPATVKTRGIEFLLLSIILGQYSCTDLICLDLVIQVNNVRGNLIN